MRVGVNFADGALSLGVVWTFGYGAGSEVAVSLSANEPSSAPGGRACRSKMNPKKALGIQAFEGRSVA
jgi:hypothetical protein